MELLTATIIDVENEDKFDQEFWDALSSVVESQTEGEEFFHIKWIWREWFDDRSERGYDDYHTVLDRLEELGYTDKDIILVKLER